MTDHVGNLKNSIAELNRLAEEDMALARTVGKPKKGKIVSIAPDVDKLRVMNGALYNALNSYGSDHHLFEDMFRHAHKESKPIATSASNALMAIKKAYEAYTNALISEIESDLKSINKTELVFVEGANLDLMNHADVKDKLVGMFRTFSTDAHYENLHTLSDREIRFDKMVNTIRIKIQAVLDKYTAIEGGMGASFDNVKALRKRLITDLEKLSNTVKIASRPHDLLIIQIQHILSDAGTDSIYDNLYKLSTDVDQLIILSIDAKKEIQELISFVDISSSNRQNQRYDAPHDETITALREISNLNLAADGSNMEDYLKKLQTYALDLQKPRNSNLFREDFQNASRHLSDTLSQIILLLKKEEKDLVWLNNRSVELAKGHHGIDSTFKPTAELENFFAQINPLTAALTDQETAFTALRDELASLLANTKSLETDTIGVKPAFHSTISIDDREDRVNNTNTELVDGINDLVNHVTSIIYSMKQVNTKRTNLVNSLNKTMSELNETSKHAADPNNTTKNVFRNTVRHLEGILNQLNERVDSKGVTTPINIGKKIIN